MQWTHSTQATKVGFLTKILFSFHCPFVASFCPFHSLRPPSQNEGNRDRRWGWDVWILPSSSETWRGCGRGSRLKPMSKLTFLLSSLERIYLGPPCSSHSHRFEGMAVTGALETYGGNTTSPSPSFITSESSGLINNWGLIFYIQRNSHYPKQ